MLRDYSLAGPSGPQAIAAGLAEADWYRSPLAKDDLARLLVRRNGPAILHTLLWFGLLAATGWTTWQLWGSWWAALPYAVYAVLYATASDSRWHECSHGTAFASDWMNNALYEISSFMVMRESVVWRWSHNRHHSDTIIVGRDPEIQVPRPTRFLPLVLSLVNWGTYASYPASLFRHAIGRISPAERSFIPPAEHGKVVRNARIILSLHGVVIALAVGLGSWLPIFLIILPHAFGTWLMIVHNTTQHAGLAENVLDHRLNCRTVYMNPLSRFIYWNMNYHVEHHMFPLVPYHALPRLHELIKDDCPPPYPSIGAAWREILPALRRQAADPDHVVARPIPPPRRQPAPAPVPTPLGPPDADGWVDIGETAAISRGEVRRIDVGRRTFAVVRSAAGTLTALDGICTHGNAHLADGLVKDGTIECPKHNGRFALRDGAPARTPICRGLATYPIEERAGRLWLNISRPGGDGGRKPPRTLRFRVVSNRLVATFITELLLEPLEPGPLGCTPGDYLQFDIPAYERIDFAGLPVTEPFRSTWERQGLLALSVGNPTAGRRNNYSLASDPASERLLRLNVRIAMPPAGSTHPPGVGSAWMFSRKPGDVVTAIGPFGDFHPRPTQREMVYIGGGAGMAPLRSHLTHLFGSSPTARKVSFWYGARSRQEVFYDDLFRDLAARHPQFSFHLVLSAPTTEDAWTGHVGLVHEVVLREYLATHRDPSAIEYYLCGPPAMITATTRMLEGLGVPPQRIACDAF